MNTEEIFSILKSALIELLEIDESKITPEAKIYQDLELDSIDAIDLIDYIKQKTGYRLLPQDFKSVVTLQDIVDCVVKKINDN